MTFHPQIWAAVLGMAILCMGGAVQAQSDESFGDQDHDRSAPIEIVSDTLDVDDENGVAVFTGNVVATQDDMLLEGQEVRAYYNEAGDIERIEAYEDVVFISAGDRATGDEGTYYMDTEMVIMMGNVVVVRDGGLSSKGDEARINLATGRAQMAGRVRTILTPQASE